LDDVRFELLFLGLLALSGIYLIRLNNWGVTISNMVMMGEIVYFLIVELLWSSSSRPVSISVAGATGVANVGIGVQIFTCYPLVALGCLNWARWRYRKSTLIPSANLPSS